MKQMTRNRQRHLLRTLRVRSGGRTWLFCRMSPAQVFTGFWANRLRGLNRYRDTDMENQRQKGTERQRNRDRQTERESLMPPAFWT